MNESLFIEQNCTIEHEGKVYESGGSWIGKSTDGKLRGVVYVSETSRTVTTWHGEKIADCSWTDYRGNFCKMRRVSFTYKGVRMIGDYCPDWSEAVKVRSTKKVD